MLVVLAGVIGALLLGWHYSHERVRNLRAANRRLLNEAHSASDAMKTPRKPYRAPDPIFWSDDVYLKLCRDVDITYPNPDLHVVGDREEHSHAESSQRKETA